MAQGRIKTLQEWIESVPGKITEREPWLLYWRGTCLLTFDPAGSYPFFERSFNAFKASGDPTGIFLSWASAVNAILYGFKNVGSLDSWLFMIDGLVARYAFPSELEEMQFISAIFYAATYMQGHHDMEKWVERAIALAQNSLDLGIRTQALSGMALYLMMRRGDMARASVTINLLRETAQFGDVTPIARIVTRLTESIYYEFTARHASCLTAVSEGLKTAEVTGVHVMDYLLLGQAAFSSLNTGDLAGAGRFIKEMASALKSPNRLHAAFYHYLSACEALRRNYIQQAAAQIDMSLRLYSDLEIFQGSALNHATKALILHELGRQKEAWQDLSRAFHIGHRIKSFYIEFSCLLTSAYFSFSEGNEAAGMISLGKAMVLGREQGLYLTFIWLPSLLTNLCAKALEEGVEVEYVQELITRCRLGSEEEYPSLFHARSSSRDNVGLAWSPGRIWIEQWPYFMKIYTLGRFEVFIDGKPVSFSGKGQQKPLSMLMVLIAFGGVEVDAEKLSDLLWPEADGDLTRLSFKFALHQLRKLIGKEHVVLLRKGRVPLNPRHCWVDVWAFGHFFEQVEKAVRQTVLMERTAEGENGGLMAETSCLRGRFALKFQNLADKAIDLYKGDFLSEERGHPWIFPMRERLKNRLIRLVDLVGSCHEKAGQWETAAYYYRKAIEVNDLQEEFYRGIMRCCQMLGLRGEAISEYNRCRSILSVTLGIEPSKETEAFFVEEGRILSSTRRGMSLMPIQMTKHAMWTLPRREANVLSGPR